MTSAFALLLFIVALYLLLNALHYGRRCTCRPIVGQSLVAGRGVFATRSYSAGEHIDQCSTVAIDYSHIQGKGPLQDYVFQSANPEKGEVLVPLGNCGLYNHSANSNADYQVSASGVINLFASRYIAKGEEILINYGTGYWNSRGLSPV